MSGGPPDIRRPEALSKLMKVLNSGFPFFESDL